MADQHLFERYRIAKALAVLRRPHEDDARGARPGVHGDWDLQFLGKRPQRLETGIVVSDAVILVLDLPDHHELRRKPINGS